MQYLLIINRLNQAYVYHSEERPFFYYLTQLQRKPGSGKIPFDKEVVKAVNSGKRITQVDCLSGQALREVYTNTMSL